MLFEIGEKVSLLKESGIFIILEIQTNIAIVRDEFSFERKVLRSELVKRQEIPLHGNIPKKEFELQQKTVKDNKGQLPQIDLHIEHLIETDSLLSAHDKFLLQIDTFKRFTNQMIQKKTNRFIVIHGVGEGKLIQEIRFLIQSKEGFSLHDANYSPRGVGASFIEIQLSKATPF
jgi:hypothetical protein